MQIHFLETELKNYKELEDTLVADGLVDKDVLKSMKVEVVKKQSGQGIPEDAEPEVKDFFEVRRSVMLRLVTKITLSLTSVNKMRTLPFRLHCFFFNKNVQDRFFYLKTTQISRSSDFSDFLSKILISHCYISKKVP